MLHHAGSGEGGGALSAVLMRARGYHRHHHAQGASITAAFGVSPLAWPWDTVFGTTFPAPEASDGKASL